MRRLLQPAFLLVVWLALFGEVSVINVLGGLLVIALVGLVFRRVERRGHSLHLVGVLRLVAVFFGRLVTSSARVVVTVLLPSPERLRSGVVGIELSHPSHLIATVVADAISLTPGTLTIDTRRPADDSERPANPTLFVHVLGLDDPEEVRRDVHSLERLVLAAITPDTTTPDPIADGLGE